MSNHSPPPALPDQAPPLPRTRIRFSLSLDSRHSTVIPPNNGRLCLAALACIAPIEAPPPCSLTSSLGESSHRRHRTRASIAVQRPAHVREQQTPLTQPSIFFYFCFCLSVATVLCSLPRHYCSSGMHLCRPCGINIGPLGHQLKGPSAFWSRHATIRSPSCTVRIHHRSRLRDLLYVSTCMGSRSLTADISSS